MSIFQAVESKGHVNIPNSTWVCCVALQCSLFDLAYLFHVHVANVYNLSIFQAVV